ncbi:MAG TPA: ABC transporter permease [Flavobacteriales bacterium]|nr:ABC transporter permease [Flavobacteriales bacterium]
MNKIKLIIQREYLTRIRKRSFIVMTILGPLLMAGLMIVPVWLSLKDVDLQIIQVIDETYAFHKEFKDSPTVIYNYSDEGIVQAKADFFKYNYTSILYIPRNAYSSPSAIRLFHKKQPSQRTLNKINNTISEVMERDRIKLKFDINRDELKALKPEINVLSISLDENGEEEESSSVLNMILGFAGAILIYFFIFLYGVQVMRGVIEEKTNRIVEIIISSVKPFQLMFGKIAGIALVGLTQFLLWVVLTSLIIVGAQRVMSDSMKHKMTEQQRMEEFMPEAEIQNEAQDNNIMQDLNENLSMINFPLLLLSFIFYFMGGYLLYGALFAAIGSAVDSEADTQQFMFPITIPLILSFVMAQSVISNPDGTLAFWFSIIPLTSPIIMMVRIPFGIQISELLLSMGLLVASFIFVTWLAGRIYRTGILMYGKKSSYRELWKWLFYNN